MVQLTIFYGYRIDSVAKTLKSWRQIHDVFTSIIIYYGCYSNVDTTLKAQRQTLFRGRYYDVARTFCQLCEERQIISMVFFYLNVVKRLVTAWNLFGVQGRHCDIKFTSSFSHTRKFLKIASRRFRKMSSNKLDSYKLISKGIAPI